MAGFVLILAILAPSAVAGGPSFGQQVECQELCSGVGGAQQEATRAAQGARGSFSPSVPTSSEQITSVASEAYRPHYNSIESLHRPYSYGAGGRAVDALFAAYGDSGRAVRSDQGAALHEAANERGTEARPRVPLSAPPACDRSAGASATTAAGTLVGRLTHAKFQAEDDPVNLDEGGDAGICPGPPAGSWSASTSPTGAPSLPAREESPPGSAFFSVDGAVGGNREDSAASLVPARPPQAVNPPVAAKRDASIVVFPGPPTSLLFALALAALALPIVVLYRRLAREEALEHPTRRAVFERIQASPGTTAGAISRVLCVDRHTALHHLRFLQSFGMIESRRVGARLRYYKNGGSFSEEEKRYHAALSSEKAHRLLSLVARNPQAPLRDLAAAAGMPKPTVKWHLDRLRAHGLLRGDGSIAPGALDVALSRSV